MNVKTVYKNLGKKIRSLREESNVSQDKLAKALGYKSRVTVFKIEKGNYTVSVHVLKKLSDFFNVPVHELIDDNELLDSKKNLYSVLRRDKSLGERDIRKIVEFIRFVKMKKAM